MAQYIPLPDGNSLKLREGESPEQGWERAQAMYPQAFGGRKDEGVKRDTSGFKAAASASASRLQGEAALTAAKIGLMDPAKAEEYYKAKEEEAKARFTPTEAGWTESPFLKFKETLGGSVPYMAAPAAAGIAALAAPVSAPVAAALGAAGAFGASAAQFTGTNIARQMDTGKSLEQTSGAAAFGAAVPQALLDTAAMALMPGIGKLFGSVGAKLTTEQARAIASQTLGKTLADYAAKTGAAMGREGVTEATQQALERLQAGLSITDPEARKEYIDSFIGGAALAGAGAPIGRYVERGAAQAQAAKADKEEKDKARLQALLQQEQDATAEKARLAQEEAAAKAARNTPEYALKVAQDYADAEKRVADLQAQVRRGTKEKPLTEEDKVYNTELGQQIKEAAAERKQLAIEKNRVTQSGLLAQAQQAQQREQMSPTEYMLAQTGEVPTSQAAAAPADTALEDFGLAFQAPVTQTEQRQREAAAAAAKPAQYAAQRMQLAQDQVVDPTGADYVEYLLADPYMANQIVEQRIELPGLSVGESSLIRKSLASKLKAEAKTELTQRQEELKGAAAKPLLPSNPMEQFLADQDMLDVARQEGMTEAEIAQVERLARMQRDVVEQGDLFGEQRTGQAAGVQRVDVGAKLDELNRQLQIAYAQRNLQRGGQYRETIRGLIEQIRDLQERSALPETGELGKQSAGIQGQLGQLPESLAAKSESETARADALTRIANGEQGLQFDIADGIVNEIKAVRGDLRPETITEIENEVKDIVAPVARYGANPDLLADVNQRLDRLSLKWRSGTERGATFTREAVPTETTTEALLRQLEEAFTNRDRYDAPTMQTLERIADNLNAVTADPERRAMIGEWLNRATTTGRPSPEMTADVRGELDRLEQGKLQENGQLELPERFMPKEVGKQTTTQVVGGKAVQVGEAGREKPARKATTFSTAAAFQKFLASDAVKALRQAIGLSSDNAARLHKRMETFRTKYTNVLANARKQEEALKARRDELLKLRGQEEQAAKQILADAQAGLDAIYRRLDAELAELQAEYISANLRFDQSASMVEEISQQIADNVAKFENKDAAYVAAVERLAALKGDAARTTAAIQQRLEGQAAGKGANIQSLLDTREKIIQAIADVRKITDRGNTSMLAFLQADMELQLRLQAAEKQMDADGKALLNAGLALDEAAKTQKRSRTNQKQIKQAQANIAAALGLTNTDLAEVTLDIDQQIEEVDNYLSTVRSTIQTAEGKLAPKEEKQQSAFEKKLAEVKIEPMTKAERDAVTARDKAKLDAFQGMTARLAAIPGTRIDFSKRQQMLEAFNAHEEQASLLAQDIKDAETGIEEMQIAIGIAEEALADTTAGYTQTQKEQFQARIGQAKERIATLQDYVKRLEAQQESMQKAYEKAVLATSSDPEIYQQVTKDLDARVEKLQKGIAENEARIAKGEAKSGKKAEPQTIAQARKRLAKYKRELKRVEALRSNRLGITRTDVLTGEKLAGQRGRKLSAEEQIQIDEAQQRKAEYDNLTNEIEALKVKKQKAEAAGKPKAPAMIQQRINELETQRAEFAPRPVGKVSAGARQQTSAPGKLRTGSAESKGTQGVSTQPLVEKRTVAQPTVAQAVAEANAFAERMQQAKTRKELEADFAAQTADTQLEIVKAAQDNVTRLSREIARNETELDALVGSKAESTAAADRIDKLRADLASARPLLNRAEADLAALKTAQEKLEGETVTEIEGTEMKQPKMGESFTSKMNLFDEPDPEEAAYRVSNKTGTSMQAQGVERLANRITEGWVNAPEIVVVETERDLPVRILNQVERDNMWGKLPGLYDPKTKKVYLVASNLYDAADVIATVAHEAAGHFGLQSMLGAGYSAMMRNIYANNANVRSKANAKMKANPNLSQDVAVEEVLADMAEGDLTPVERNMMQRLFDMIRNFARKLLGKDAVLSDNEVRQVVANARKYVIEGGVAGEGKAQTGEATYRTGKTVDNALSDLADKIVATPKTTREKIKDITALELEMTGVDMRAGLQAALKRGAQAMGDDTLYQQAMYNVRKADQKIPMAYAAMSNGPLELYKDEKGFYGVRSSGKDSAVSVFEAVGKVPAGSSQEKFALASAYLLAQRAANKGLSKLDTGALGVDEADLAAAMAAAKADPALGRALEEVRRRYNAYNKGLIEFLSSTGAISKKLANELLSTGDYVPFYRVRENGMAELVFSEKMVVSIGDIRSQPYLAELKGGEQKILPLSESLPRNTLLLVDKGLTNLAQRNVAYGLQAIGKGQGPVDSKTGKPKDLMAIHKGDGPADPRVIRFNQEPDPKDPKDDGKRWLRVESNGTAIEGIPAELVVKSLEGAHLTLPGFLKLGGAAADLLRAGVTRTPLYIARQLYKEPMAATFTGGLNYTPFRAVLEAGKEYIRMMRGQSETQARLIEKGLIQSNVFSGDVDDIQKIALQLARGGDQATIDRVFGALDRAAINADAATRALVYDNARKNGLSEVQADMMTMESMNFYKRGLSPTVQYANRLIPFLNAQIQSLNVLYKAMTGQMPFEEALNIKRKFYNNAMLLFATGLVYAMAMEDDEYFKNARPRDKYTNFFLHLPGVDEPIKIATPFEAGYFFSLAVAAVDGMKRETNNAEQFAALRDLFLQSIPGYTSMGIPQIAKPVFEVWTNKNFFTGAPIESLRLKNMDITQRYNESTTEMAKALSQAVPILSPIQIEHIVRGYLGIMPLAAAAMANSAVPTPERGERPTGRASDLPFIGSAFQRKMGGAQADEVYDLAEAAFQARTTFNTMLKEGRREEAKTYREENRVELASAIDAGQYRQLVGRLNSDIRRTQNRTDLTGDEKRARIDRLEDAKIKAAKDFLTRYRAREDRLGG